MLVTKNVNKILHDQFAQLNKRFVVTERKSYANEQYSRNECVEVSGIPGSVNHEDLEKKVLDVFSKIGANIATDKIEACHRISARNSNVIVKFSNRKDRINTMNKKMNLKDMNLSDIGITNKVFINSNLCPFYKMLRWKCRKLFDAVKIDSFWVAGTKVMLRVSEHDVATHVSHDEDINVLFPEEDLENIYNTVYPPRNRRPRK